jgi:hypothetical protein
MPPAGFEALDRVATGIGSAFLVSRSKILNIGVKYACLLHIPLYVWKYQLAKMWSYKVLFHMQKYCR